MNYITQINGFYIWLETNELSASAINLWHALMHIANKTGWQDNFTVAMSVLEIKTGLQKQAIQRARVQLRDKGRISFKSRSGNQSAVYQLIPIPEREDDFIHKVIRNLIHNMILKVIRKVIRSPIHKVSLLINKTRINKTKRNKTCSLCQRLHLTLSNYLMQFVLTFLQRAS